MNARMSMSWLAVWLGCGCTLAAVAEREIPPAFGPHIRPPAAEFERSRSFSTNDRVVMTYYFYWYDIYSRGHIVDHDGTDALTTHPRTMDDFSYRSVAWHKRQLLDMMDAGIDVLLPVFWGAPSEQQTNTVLHWSYAGLPPLVAAREELLKEGKNPPRIGLFYDTSTLQHNAWHAHIDLTSDFGRRWFYATIRDFFSMIPARHWAMVEGRPIVLFYSASYAMRHDQSCFDYVKAHFPEEFGGSVPYLVREVSWQVKGDNTCAWGGALGLKNPGVAAIGPGYDHSAVPNRDPLVVPRNGGAFYETNWLKFLRRPSNLVVLETWNEFHEGTDIADSREYGRQFIELTRKYASLFKSGFVPPRPRGAYTGAKSVNVTLGERDVEAGLKLVENDDGLSAPAVFQDRPGRASKASRNAGRYLYFVVDDSFKWADVMNARLEVEYFDAVPGSFGLEYDGSDPEAVFAGAYTGSSQRVRLAGDRQWKRAVFSLPKARFENSQNRGADFRLLIHTSEFGVGRVTLSKE